MITVYGIPNCDSVKKARTWLADAGVEHAFHDFRKSGVTEASLRRWIAAQGWERVLNRKGTTWRQLDVATRDAVTGADQAVTLMLAQPTLIKRPVIEWPQGRITVGHDPEAYVAPSR